MFRCQYKTGTIDNLKVIDFFSDSGLFSIGASGIYELIDDILVLAVDIFDFNLWDTNFHPGEGITVKDFRAPFFLYSTLTAFIIAVRLEALESRKHVLDVPICKPCNAEKNPLDGDYLWAHRLHDIKAYLESRDLLAKLLYALDSLPVNAEHPNSYDKRTRSQAIVLAQSKFGHLYPIARWTIRGTRIFQHYPWLAPAKPIFEFDVSSVGQKSGLIDIYPLDSNGNRWPGAALLGIYYILDDFLLLCYNDWRSSGLPKQERPQRFMSTKEKPYTVEVLRRLHEQDIPRSTKRDQ